MKTLSKAVVLAFLLPLAGCAVSAESDEAEQGGPASTEAAPAHASSAALEACGKDTVASIVDHDDRRLTFCVTQQGREIIMEDAPQGLAPVVPRRPSKKASGAAPAAAPTCGLDLYLAHTSADVDVPMALKESCERKLGVVRDIPGRTLTQHAVIQQHQAQPGVLPQKAYTFDSTSSTKYCNTLTGPAAFQQDFCSQLCQTSHDCIQACTPRYWGSSLRWCSESDWAYEAIASCTGWTHLVADARDSSSDPWHVQLDTWVGPNRQTWATIDDGPSIWTDSDLRFRGTSEAGASHMHAFDCTDY